jgi:[NiFe] hydrogenase assembly HybE family chaperone
MTAISERLEAVAAVYRRIHREQMTGLPIVNPALRVEPIGFVEWESHLLGILIAPWLFNLMLLPGKDDDWSELPLLGKQAHRLPEGDYQFIVADLEGIGRHQTCSLFTTVTDFPDQETARLTAEHIMTALLRPPCPSSEQPPPSPDDSIREGLAQPLSRRELLRRAVRADPPS